MRTSLVFQSTCKRTQNAKLTFRKQCCVDYINYSSSFLKRTKENSCAGKCVWQLIQSQCFFRSMAYNNKSVNHYSGMYFFFFVFPALLYSIHVYHKKPKGMMHILMCVHSFTPIQ